MVNFITLYMQIFCILSLVMYITYTLVIIPFRATLPLNITKIFDSVIIDFVLFMAILTIFYILNNTVFHIYHALFISIELMITISMGILLASVISYFATSNFNISQLAKYIIYLVLFILFFMFYIIAVFKPYN